MRLARTMIATALVLIGAAAAGAQEPAAPSAVPPQPAVVYVPGTAAPQSPSAARPAAPSQRAPVPMPAAPRGPRLGSLSIVLLEGDASGGGSLDGVPPAVQDALGDMREFLPFRSYRLYDAGLLRAPNPLTESTIYLRGEPAGRRFAVTLGVRYQVTPTRLDVSFSLREIGDKSPALETSLNMNVGETIIVGTSRIGGDRALIALLTAVPAE